MATTTDLEQTGRDANILNNYLDGAPPLRPANEYGRLGQLILRLIEELGSGTLLRYDGRVDSVADLPATGQLNHFYLVGPEDSENFDEYFWVEPEGETGHWDRLGSVAIVIDDHFDLNSANPVQNGVITAAINAINLALAATAKQSALAPVLVFATSYTDGTLVTYAGELYKADSVNGSYITEDQIASTSKFVKVDVASLFNGLATVAKTGSYNDLTDKPTTDATPTQSSTNPVQSGGVYTALEGKQNTLTFDSTPTASSNNPVTSDGIKTALDGKVTEGTGYAVINGIRVYVSPTTPTGTIPENSLGIGF